MAELGQAYKVLAARAAVSTTAVSVLVVDVFLQCFKALARPCREKLLTPLLLRSIIATIAEVVNQHLDFTRADTWTGQSAIVLIPTARSCRVERVSQLYRETIATVAATSDC